VASGLEWTVDRLRDLAHVAHDWDNNFSPLPGGYFVTRGADSTLIGVHCWSCDPSFVRRTFIRNDSVPGLIGAFPTSGSMLPTSLCPMVEWTSSDGRRYKPRTFLPCFASPLSLYSNDAMVPPLSVRAVVQVVADDWLSRVNGAGFVPVTVERQRGGVALEPVVLHQITGAKVAVWRYGVKARRSPGSLQAARAF
jgi:hypothetical protein